MYKIGSMPKSIPIGYTGETNFRKIEIDMNAWLDKMPAGVPSIVHVRPGESKTDAYVAVTEFDRETGILFWTITAADIGTLEGEGEMQVWLEETENDSVSKRGKSVKVITKVIDAVNDPDETVPSTQEAFLEQVTSLKTQTVTAAEAAEAAQAAAEDAVEKYPYIDGTTGNWMLWDAVNEVWTDSGVHAQGPQGAAGAKGDTGATGDQGPKGDKGDKGDTGEQGPAGQDGADGQDGATGPQGPKGDKGDKGDTGDPGDPTELIDDTAGEGETEKTWSADKLDETTSQLLNHIHQLAVTPEMFGAKGDGVTDDSQAVQDAVDSGYNVRFADNKTYYLADTVNINHDCHLSGGKNTVIKTQSVTENGQTTLNKAFSVSGELKKVTTLTTDYTEEGDTDNSSNKFTFEDMEDIEIGDLIEIVAEDQFYSYARQYYYLGGMLLVSEIREGHIYTCDNLPFDIENTNNVTVKIYDAPEVHFENLNFVSDRGQVGFKFFVDFQYCKHSTIKNCNMTEAWNLVRFYKCYDSVVDCVSLSRSKYDNSIGIDSYGICIESCTNTIVQRIHSICSQECISLTGSIPVINTFVRHCNVSAECRAVGISTHENTYNLIIEDCDVGGISVSGTVKIKRCRIYTNNRLGGSFGISVRGNHNERYARFSIIDCEFSKDQDGFISISTQSPQNPIQSYDSIIGELFIKNCKNGFLKADFSSSPVTILSNVVKKLIIDNWQDCYEIYHKSIVFEQIQIIESTFKNKYWINKHTSAINVDNIRFMRLSSVKPMFERLIVDNVDNGGRYIIPSGKSIEVSSLDDTAHYAICGRNLMPNDPTEISVGNVSGSVGGDLTRTVDPNFSTALSVSDGCLVYTQPNNTTKENIYMKSFVCAEEKGTVDIKVTLKNIGETDGASFRAYVAGIDVKTGKVAFRDVGSAVEATVNGAELTYTHSLQEDQIYFCYLYCNNPVKNAVTKFEDFMVQFVPFGLSAQNFEQYNGVSRDGNGTLISREGINNIVSSAINFETKFATEI